MFVAPLKNNFQTSLIILTVLSIVLWILSFQFVTAPNLAPPQYQHILYDYFFLGTSSFFGKQVIILLSIVIGAFMVNFISINQEITSKTNYLPAFIYILIGFSSSVTHSIQPILIANVFLLPALYFIINSYRAENTLTPFYNAGLFLGLASFFYTFYVFLFPVVFIALIISRSFNWREWLMLLIGILTPLYFYQCICYLKSESVFKSLTILKENLSNAQLFSLSEYDSLFLTMLAFTFILGLFHYLKKGFGNKIKTTKTKYILLWLLVFSGISMIYNQPNELLFLPLSISLSILVGDYLALIKQLKVANTLLFLIIAGFAVIYAHALGLF